MGGPTKDKKNTSHCEKDAAPRGRGFEIAVGTKVEAMDYLGTWYNAKIIKVKKDKKEILIHFDGWNSRFDVWLPHDSKKLRDAKSVKQKGHDWRVGARVVAKWGPANKIYPAIVSRITSDSCVEVRFYDGFKKTLKKSSLQPDTEKLYRQYGEGSAIKEILNLSTPGDKKKITSTSTPNTDETNASLRAKRRLTEPPGMADYVTDMHKKGRRSLKGGELLVSEDDKSSLCGDVTSTAQDMPSPIPSTHTAKKDKLAEKTPVPTMDKKVKTENVISTNNENNEKTLSIDDEENISSQLSSSIPKLKLRKDKRSQSNVEIVKSNSSSYMMFPIMSSPDDSDDNSSMNIQSLEPNWEIASPPNALVNITEKTPIETKQSDEVNEIDHVVEHDKENVMETCQPDQQKDDKDGEIVTKNALTDKGFSTQTKEYSLFTDMLSKLPENTQETRRRRSDPKLNSISSESLRKRAEKDENLNKSKSISSDSDEDKTLKAVKQAKLGKQAKAEKQNTELNESQETYVSKESKDKLKTKKIDVKESPRFLRNKESKGADAKESPRLLRNSESELQKNEIIRRSARDAKTKEADDKTNKIKEGQKDTNKSKSTVKVESKSPIKVQPAHTTPKISLRSSEMKSEEKSADRSLRLRDSKINTKDDQKSSVTKSVNKKQEAGSLQRKDSTSHSVSKTSKEVKDKSQKDIDKSEGGSTTERRVSSRSSTINLTEEFKKKEKNSDQINVKEKKTVEASSSTTCRSLRGKEEKDEKIDEAKSTRRSSRVSKEEEKLETIDEAKLARRSSRGSKEEEKDETIDKTMLARRSSRGSKEEEKDEAIDKAILARRSSRGSKEEEKLETIDEAKLARRSSRGSKEEEKDETIDKTMLARRSSRGSKEEEKDEAIDKAKLARRSSRGSKEEEKVETINEAKLARRSSRGSKEEEKDETIDKTMLVRRSSKGSKEEEKEEIIDKAMLARRSSRGSKEEETDEAIDKPKLTRRSSRGSKEEEKEDTIDEAKLARRSSRGSKEEEKEDTIVEAKDSQRSISASKEEEKEDTIGEAKLARRSSRGSKEEEKEDAIVEAKPSQRSISASKEEEKEDTIDEAKLARRSSRGSKEEEKEDTIVEAKHSQRSISASKEEEKEDTIGEAKLARRSSRGSKEEEKEGAIVEAKPSQCSIRASEEEEKEETIHEAKPARRSSRGSKEEEKAEEDKNKDSRAIRTKRRHTLEMEEKKKPSLEELVKNDKQKAVKTTIDVSSTDARLTSTEVEAPILNKEKANEEPQTLVEEQKSVEEESVQEKVIAADDKDEEQSPPVEDDVSIDKTEVTEEMSIEEKRSDKKVEREDGLTSKPDNISEDSIQSSTQPPETAETAAKTAEISIKEESVFIEESDSAELEIPETISLSKVTSSIKQDTEKTSKSILHKKKSEEINVNVNQKQIDAASIKTDVVSTIPSVLPGGKGYIYTTNVVNIFQEIVPDLNSGRPVRKNKLKKPARYSNESEELLHSKSKKEAKEAPVTKTPLASKEKTSTKVRRDSKDRKLSVDGKDPHERKVSIDAKDKKERKLSVHIADIATPKVEIELTEKKSPVVLTNITPPIVVPAKEIEVEKSVSIDETPMGNATAQVEVDTVKVETFAPVIKKVATGKVGSDATGKVGASVTSKVGAVPRVRRDSKDMGARRNEVNNIPMKGSKITKAKISLQTVTGRAHGVVNKKFEEKYEMFKKKWKEEKERRRMQQQQQQQQAGSTEVTTGVTVKKAVIDHGKTIRYEAVSNQVQRQSTKAKGSPVKIKMWGEKMGLKIRSRIKHTPHSRFGKALRGKSPIKKNKVKTMQKSKNNSEVMETPPEVMESPPVVVVIVGDKEVNAEAGSVIVKETIPPVIVVKEKEGSNTVQQSEIEKASIEIISNEKEALTKKGKPRKKRKIHESVFNNDTSRTPNDTISFASMIENERPSQRKRLDAAITTSQPTLPQVNKSPMKYPIPSPHQVFPPRYMIPNFQQRPFFAYAPRPYSFPSAAQIAASRIQKRVHHKKLMSMLNSPEHQPQLKGNIDLCNYPPTSSYLQDEKKPSGAQSAEDDSDDSILVVQPSVEAAAKKGDTESSEIDLTDIALDKSTTSNAPPKKRQSLDFITARLNYKQKQKRQRIDSVVGRLKHNQEMDSNEQKQQQHPPVATSAHQQHPQQQQEAIPMPYGNFPNMAPQQMRPMPPQMMNIPPPQMGPNATMYLPMQRMPIPMTHVQVLNPAVISSQQHMIPFPHNPMMRPGGDFTNVHPYRPIMGPMEHHHHMIQQGFIRPGPHMHPFQNPALNPHLHHRMMHPHVGPGPVPGFPQQPLPHDGGSGGSSGPTGISTKEMKAGEKKASEDSNPESVKPLASTKKTLVKEECGEVKKMSEAVAVKEESADEKRLVIDETSGESKKRKKSGSKQPATEKENLYALRREKRARNSKDNEIKKIKVEAEKSLTTKDSSAPSTPSLPPPPSVETSTATIALTEYKCTITDCGKVFRKSHLLEYHIKYFHTAKPFQKRSRSSASVSFSESSPVASFTASAETSPKALTGVINQSEDLKFSSAPSSEVEFTEQSDSTMSESESESEDEIPSVDDCVKCLCEDECELGFMIQCEQCFTWQHGECVGYSSPKAVPLFYLCHVCSNPKGLRKSSKYSNDYTWYRHGLLPPLRQDAPEDAKLDELEFNKHVDLENEEILSTIMLATHAMTTDLYNIRDVLQGIRNKFTLINDPKNPDLLDWKGNNDEKSLAEMFEKIKQDDDDDDDDDKQHQNNTSTNQITANVETTNETKNITEMFNKDLNKRLTTINNKNNASSSMSNETSIEESSSDKPNDANVNKNEKNNTADPTCSNTTETSADSVEDDVFVVVSSMVQMLCYTAEKDNSLRTHCESKLKELSSHHNTLNESNKKVVDVKENASSGSTCTDNDNIVEDVQLLLKDTIEKVNEQVDCEEDFDITNEDFILKDIVENIVTRVCRKERNDIVVSTDDKVNDGVNLDETLPYMKETPDKPAIVSKQNDLSKGVRHLLKDAYTTLTANADKNSLPDEDEYIDVGNLSEEDSIPYMETDEEFFPVTDQPNSSLETRSTMTSFENEFGSFKQLSCHGIDTILKDQGDWSDASRESLIARYNILVEIEKVEDQINERLQDMNSKLDELESEYDSIDKSKAILEDFKRNFKLPDLKSLMSHLNDVKWKSIIKSNMDKNVARGHFFRSIHA